MMETDNPFSLEGKNILVTGASSGIGQATAIACSKMKANVCITGRSEVKLNHTMSMMQGETLSLVGDLTNPDDVNRLLSSLPVLDGVVNCAGIGYRMPTKMIRQEDISLVMKTNFEATVLLQSALLQNKKISKGASIVFIASKAAEYPSFGNAIYSASKGAIISYAKCLALEQAPRKVRVNCICPTMVWTDLILQNEVTKEQLMEDEQRYPLRRYGKPEDIANLTLFLLSDASSWMTNSCIDITGGSMEL